MGTIYAGLLDRFDANADAELGFSQACGKCFNISARKMELQKHNFIYIA
jgi:hypothetical protein